MASAGTVTLNLDANSVKLMRELQKAQNQTRTSANSMAQSFGNAFKSIAKASAVALGAVAAMTIAATKRGLETVDAQAKLARQLNTTSASMATLQRAGDLSGVSMEKITTSSRQLDIAMGRASQGIKAQADIFDRLQLSTEELAGVPLDERIIKINEAINKNIPAVERASVAAELFGSRNAAAMLTLDSGAMQRAAQEAQVFGLAISELDAEKVQTANDSFARFGMMIQGITKQLAIQFAPILDAVGKMFFNAAKDAGGFGETVPKAFNKTITVIGFLADAIEVLRRAFIIVTESGVMAISKLNEVTARGVATILETLSRIPGINFENSIESVRDFERTSSLVVAQARANIEEQLGKPMPSTVFKQFIAEAQEASEAAARASLELRESLNIPEIIEEVLEDMVEDVETELTQMQEFGLQAARNLQNHFAEFLFNPFKDGLRGMAEGFINTLRKMMAEAASAKILGAFMGMLSGSANPLIAGIGAAFGGTRDLGGRGAAGKAYMIGKGAQPEMFIPDSAGTFIPNADKMGGTSFAITIDARDPGAEGRIRTMIEQEMAPQIIEAAQGRTIASMRRPRFA